MSPPFGGATALGALGTYHHLNYNGLSVITLGVNGNVTAGVEPESMSNVIGYGTKTAALGGDPIISANYSESAAGPAGCFTLKRFYFGCDLGKVTAENAPVACTVTITGLTYAGATVAPQKFVFKPTSFALSSMAEAVLASRFSKLKSVRFSTTYSEPVAGTLLDNLSYTVFRRA